MSRASYFYLVYESGKLNRIFTVKYEAVAYIDRTKPKDPRLKRLRAWQPLEKQEDITDELTPVDFRVVPNTACLVCDTPVEPGRVVCAQDERKDEGNGRE